MITLWGLSYFYLQIVLILALFLDLSCPMRYELVTALSKFLLKEVSGTYNVTSEQNVSLAPFPHLSQCRPVALLLHSLYKPHRNVPGGGKVLSPLRQHQR